MKLRLPRPQICNIRGGGVFFWRLVLAAQTELEAPLWICFTHFYECLIFYGKIKFPIFFHRKIFPLKFRHFRKFSKINIFKNLEQNRKCSKILKKSWFLTSKPNLGITHSLNCPKDAKNGFFGKLYIDIVIRKFSKTFFRSKK